MHFVYASVLTGTIVIPLHFAKQNAMVQKLMIATDIKMTKLLMHIFTGNAIEIAR